MDPVGTMAGPVAADIACQAAVGGYHASSIRVPYEDYSTGASSVVVRVLEITQDPPPCSCAGNCASRGLLRFASLQRISDSGPRCRTEACGVDSVRIALQHGNMGCCGCGGGGGGGARRAGGGAAGRGNSKGSKAMPQAEGQGEGKADGRAVAAPGVAQRGVGACAQVGEAAPGTPAAKQAKKPKAVQKAQQVQQAAAAAAAAAVGAAAGRKGKAATKGKGKGKGAVAVGARQARQAQQPQQPQQQEPEHFGQPPRGRRQPLETATPRKAASW
jgi:hypothetical protein